MQSTNYENEAFCPECGAPLPTGGTCRDYFDACLALEFSEPAYFAVHFLTVPTYLLQHPGQLSKQGWLAMREALSHSVRNDAPQSVYGGEFRKEMDNSRRDFRFHGGEPMRLPKTVHWTKTIADVRLTNPELYCADVRAWAQAVVADIKALFPNDI